MQYKIASCAYFDLFGPLTCLVPLSHGLCGDFAVAYEINAYCDQPLEMLELYTALHQNILDLFNEYGVQIMTPSYEGDPDQAKIVPRNRWYAAPARPPGSGEFVDSREEAGGGTEEKPPVKGVA